MPGHLNERTLRDFQVKQYRYFGENIDGLQNFVEKLLNRISILEERVSILEAKRKPGRPRNAENEENRA